MKKERQKNYDLNSPLPNSDNYYCYICSKKLEEYQPVNFFIFLFKISAFFYGGTFRKLQEVKLYKGFS